MRRGAKLVEINGAIIEVEAKISDVEGLSGHAGREDVVAWLRGIKAKPAKVLLNHGTETSRIALASAIEHELGLTCVRSLAGERIEA